MTPSTRIAGVALVLVAALVQASIAWRIDIDGAVPHVLMLVVASLALLSGAISGAAYGFLAGLSIAIFAALPLGPHALVATLIGYAIGRVGEVLVTDDHPAPPLIAGIVACAAMLLGRPLIEFLVNPDSNSIEGVFGLAFVSTAMTAVLALPVYLLVRRVLILAGGTTRSTVPIPSGAEGTHG